MTQRMILIGAAVAILPLALAAPATAQGCGQGGEGCEDWCVGSSCGKPPMARSINSSPGAVDLVTFSFELSIDVEFTIGSSVTVLIVTGTSGDEVLNLKATQLDTGTAELTLDYQISPAVYGTLVVGQSVDTLFDAWTITWDARVAAPAITVLRNQDEYSADPPALSGQIRSGLQGVPAYQGDVDGWISMTPVVVD